MSVSPSCSSFWVCLCSPTVILYARYGSPASPYSLWLFGTVVAVVAFEVLRLDFRSSCGGLGRVLVSSGAFNSEVRLELGVQAEFAPGLCPVLRRGFKGVVSACFSVDSVGRLWPPETVFSPAWLWSSVLDDHKCGGGSRGVMTTSVSTLDLSSHPGAASASLLSRGGDLDILCRFLEPFSDSYESRASGTSYSGSNLGSPGIQGNEENLTFSRSLPMVENGDRFLRISKIRLVERAEFSGWAKLEYLVNDFSLSPQRHPSVSKVTVTANAYSLAEFLWLRGWWNEQRMWLYRRTSSFLFGFVDTIKKKLGVSESAFVITAKVAEEEAAERYEKEVMEFRVESLLFLLLGTLGMLNLFCLAASIMRLVMTSSEAGGDVQTMGMQFVIT
ncbi:hypothetical protein F2Q68_00006954 [Brassica cretica]|uniref:Uncharacterized protein n=1 Tax=Brassica cretica TaxID=69181 RepID=A0A8S9J786_BRACR|nr:hypothetical protein F2Q68_00006954 [Brassica cretica]